MQFIHYREETIVVPATGVAGSATGTASWKLGPYGGTAQVIEVTAIVFDTGQPVGATVDIFDHMSGRSLLGATKLANSSPAMPRSINDYAAEQIDVTITAANPDPVSVKVTLVIATG